MAKEPAAASADFLATLEQGVRDVLKNRASKPSERVAAITAGARLLMIRHKISTDDETHFFEK